MNILKRIRLLSRPIRRYIKSILIKDKRLTVLKEYDGILFNLYKNNTLENEIIQTGSFEKVIQTLFKNIIKDNNVVFDVGANVGVHATLFSKLVGNNGKVYAFEPVRHNIKRLNMNLRLNGVQNVNIIDKGVGDKNTIQTMNVFKEDSPNLAVSSFIDYDYIQKEFENGLVEKEEFEIVTLDSFVEENTINQVDFLKIDVEGFEYYVLSGAKEIIRKYKPTILFEFYSKRIVDIGLSNKEFKDILDSYYDCYEIVKDPIHHTIFSLIEFNFDREIYESDIICLPKRY